LVVHVRRQLLLLLLLLMCLLLLLLLGRLTLQAAVPQTPPGSSTRTHGGGIAGCIGGGVGAGRQWHPDSGSGSGRALQGVCVLLYWLRWPLSWPGQCAPLHRHQRG